MLENIKKKFPSFKINTVHELKLNDTASLYGFTVENGAAMAYTNATADFILVGGELLTGDEASLRSVTRDRIQQQINEAYSALDREKGIKFVYGNGTREMFVLSDPDCPMCMGLEEMLATAGAQFNATVYVIPYPLKELHPDAARKARVIACSPNPSSH